MKRQKHSLSHYKLASFDMGQLVPVGHFEVLPGDSIRHATSSLIRVLPLQSPVMHPVTVRLHHWFVPYRLLWTGWEDFITGGNDGLGGSSGDFPTVTTTAAPGDFQAPKTGLLDHLGIPPEIDATVSALPIRAYQLIWNEYYRDQDLQTAATINKGSGDDQTTDWTIRKICWEKDYFTSARPWTSRGSEVVLPLGTQADVVFPTATTDFLGTDLQNGTPTSRGNLQNQNGASGIDASNSNQTVEQLYLKTPVTWPTDAYADLTGATAAAVNDIRRAFALQRYQEARAQYGARYVEYLRYLGIRSSDARLQRPEYLGGGKQTISFSEVLQTGPDFDANSGVATMRGHGIAALRSNRYVRFFEEHGIVMTLASVRPKSMYNDGIHRSWLRRTKEDFWQKELEQIGQQEIQNQEVYAEAAVPAGTFGYQDRYAEYRHLPSTVSSEFRDILNDWHLARIFGSEPSLNSAFVTCEPTKRVHSVQTNNVLWCLFNHSIQARRMVGKKTIGRII